MSETLSSTVEILERHANDKMPDTGNGSIIAPNVLRINGDDIWSAKDYPIEVGPLGYYPLGSDALVVPIVMTVRLTDHRVPAPAAPGNRHAPPAATLELHADRVVLNGRRVWVHEHGVEVIWRYAGTDCARIRIHLFARRLVVDDDPSDVSKLPMLNKWGLIGDDIPTLTAA